MAHDHAHDDPKSYYVEQLCTIGICGALGGIAFMLYQRELLWFLTDKVQPWVLGGGIILLVLVVVRAVVVWFQAGRTPAAAHVHDHDHEHSRAHGEDCGHDHHHDHAHGENHSHGNGHGGGDGHEHGWAPWRYVILLLPVVLYFLGLPNERMAKANEKDGILFGGDLTAVNVSDQEQGKVFKVGFPELQRAPVTADSRRFYEGKTIRITGEYLPGNDRMFTLVRYKMNCCARDAVPLRAVILLDPKFTTPLPQEQLRRKWVQVQGQLQFQPSPEQPDTWITIIVLKPDEEHPLIDSDSKSDKGLIKVVEPEANYYLS